MVTTQVHGFTVHGSRLEQPTVNCEPDNLSSCDKFTECVVLKGWMDRI